MYHASFSLTLLFLQLVQCGFLVGTTFIVAQVFAELWGQQVPGAAHNPDRWEAMEIDVFPQITTMALFQNKTQAGQRGTEYVPQGEKIMNHGRGWEVVPTLGSL